MVSTLPIRRSCVLNIPVVHTSILTLHVESCLGLACLDDKVIIAVRAVFVTETNKLARCHLDFEPFLAYVSSNSAASLRKHFLHFLHAKIYPMECQPARLALTGE